MIELVTTNDIICCFFVVMSISHFIQRYILFSMKLLVNKHLKINPAKNLPYLKNSSLDFFNTGICVKILHVTSFTRVEQVSLFPIERVVSLYSCAPKIFPQLSEANKRFPLKQPSNEKFPFTPSLGTEIDLLCQLGVNNP